MNYFLNFKNGQTEINTYRLSEAIVTDVDDIINAYDTERDECLTASLDCWIKDKINQLLTELKKHSFNSKEEIKNAVFNDNDFLEKVLENQFDIKLSEYPELRDYQNDLIEELAEFHKLI